MLYSLENVILVSCNMGWLHVVFQIRLGINI